MGRHMMEGAFKLSSAAMRKMAWSDHGGSDASEKDIVQMQVRDGGCQEQVQCRGKQMGLH